MVWCCRRSRIGGSGASPSAPSGGGADEHGLRFGKLEDALIAAGAPSDKAAEAAEEVADVVALPHRMERRLVRVEVLVGSTLGGVGPVGAGVLATVLKIYLG